MSIDAISFKELMHYKLQAVMREHSPQGLSYVGMFNGEHMYNLAGVVVPVSQISKFELN